MKDLLPPDLLANMAKRTLCTAGAGGAETEACRLFGDDVVEVIRAVRATLANIEQIRSLGFESDANSANSVVFETFLIRVVDHALSYVASSLHAVLRKYPDSVGAKEELDLRFISNFSSIDELVEALVERKVCHVHHERQ